MLIRRTHGFTLLEIVITLAIFSFVIMLGIPSYSAWVINARIRANADAGMTGLQLARNEAMRLNQPVSFLLYTDGGWRVERFFDNSLIQQRAKAEGAGDVTIAATGGNSIVFDGLGRVWLPDSTATGWNVGNPLTAVDYSVPTTTLAASDQKPLRIVIDAVGGSVRMCSPNVTDVTDPRSC